MLAEDGTPYRLVPEERVAWHAGRSGWRGREALNGSSIGIEIVNLHGDRHDYPARQVEALVATAQSIRSKRATLAWPDTVQVSDLRNGALPRSTASVRTLAGDVPGYYVACQIGGACAGLPAQHGLTNLGLSGVNVLQATSASATTNPSTTA